LPDKWLVHYKSLYFYDIRISQSQFDQVFDISF
jgi:hypothetical protein